MAACAGPGATGGGDEYTCAIPPTGRGAPPRQVQEGKRCVPTDAFSKGIPPQLGKLHPPGPQSSKAKTWDDFGIRLKSEHPPQTGAAHFVGGQSC